MPLRQRRQEFGYHGCTKGTVGKSGASDSSRFRGLPYSKYVGRVFVVSAVTKANSFGGYSVNFVESAGTDAVSCLTTGGTIDGLASADLIDAARSRYLAKTLWPSDSELGTYNATTDEMDFISIPRYEPLMVTEVAVSTERDAPIRLIVKTLDGRAGFVDLALNDTNVDPSLASYHRIEDHLLEMDPRTVAGESDEVWAAIKGRKVLLNMTPEQVILSRGKPNQINRTETAEGKSEQWVYRAASKNFHIYFRGGRVTATEQ